MPPSAGKNDMTSSSRECPHAFNVARSRESLVVDSALNLLLDVFARLHLPFEFEYRLRLKRARRSSGRPIPYFWKSTARPLQTAAEVEVLDALIIQQIGGRHLVAFFVRQRDEASQIARD
jgi:hypothetical protein